MINEATGEVIGIHTHKECNNRDDPTNTNSGINHGTRIDKPDLAAHIDFLTKSCYSDSDCLDNIFCNGMSNICFLFDGCYAQTSPPR